jgi:ABC-type antimicrobial peptide transport system permease subunit
VRLALGARPRQVGARFVALGARLLAAGLTLGLGSWWAVSRALAAWLAGMPSAPASATVLATAVMVTVCVFACAIPARRAMRLSPIDALQD